LLLALWLFSGRGWLVFAQQAQSNHTPRLQPLSLPHLYWHFLIYVKVLDRKADELAAQGNNADWLRNDLQTRLQFSDADFAPIRASSRHLSLALTPINQQLQALRPASPSAYRTSQMHALIAQRETYINNEMASLAQSLSPAKRRALEAFITQFFAPKNLTLQTPAAQTNH
jgi:hypothetical protein